MSCVCADVRACQRPATWVKLRLKGGFHPQFGMCVVLPWCLLMALGALPALQPSLRSFWGLGLPARSVRPHSPLHLPFLALPPA